MPSPFSDQLAKTRLEDGLKEGIKQKYFTHGVAAFRTSGRWTIVDPLKNDQVVFDLASLTKVLGMTTLIARMREERRISLGLPLHEMLNDLGEKLKLKISPDCQRAFADVQLCHLLSHTAPFSSRLHFFKSIKPNELPDRKQLMRDYFSFFLQSGVDRRDAHSALYSDVGFQLLGFYLELHAKKSLAEIFQEFQVSPTLTFSPVVENCAPTGLCPWRGAVVAGAVQDEESFVFGGTTGHAGLFGTIHQVQEAFESWIASFPNEQGTKTFTANTIETFCRGNPKGRSAVGHCFRLGWDGASPSGELSRIGWSPSTVGHWGFTGVGLWYDPEQSCAMIYLTNRVHCSVQVTEPFRAWRKNLFNLIQN